MDLNNRRTGKHATKPRALGLLGHSEVDCTIKESLTATTHQDGGIIMIILYNLFDFDR